MNFRTEEDRSTAKLSLWRRQRPSWSEVMKIRRRVARRKKRMFGTDPTITPSSVFKLTQRGQDWQEPSEMHAKLPCHYVVKGRVERLTHGCPESVLATTVGADPVRDWLCVPKPNKEAAEVLRVATLGMVPPVYKMLREALEKEVRGGKVGMLRRGHVDASRVTRVVSDFSSRVFCKPATRKKVRAVVSLVMDDTASMQVPRYGASLHQMSAQMVYAIGTALSRFGVAFEVLSHARKIFTPNPRGYKQTQQMIRPKGRENWTLMVYKSFTEKWDRVRDRIGNYLCNSGNSYEPDAVYHAASRLLTRQEDSKVILLLSDGVPMPGMGVPNVYLEKDFSILPGEMRKLGIKLVGVGLGTDYLEKKMGSANALTVLNFDHFSTVVMENILKRIKH